MKPFRYKGLYGYKANGKVVIARQFRNASKFSEGLAAVQTDNGLWGFIDVTGKMVIEPQFEYAGDFYKGRAVFRKNGQRGCIDKQGNLLIEEEV